MFDDIMQNVRHPDDASRTVRIIQNGQLSISALPHQLYGSRHRVGVANRYRVACHDGVNACFKPFATGHELHGVAFGEDAAQNTLTDDQCAALSLLSHLSQNVTDGRRAADNQRKSRANVLDSFRFDLEQVSTQQNSRMVKGEMY